MHRVRSSLTVLLLAVVSLTAQADPLTFEVVLDPSVHTGPYSGRIYVCMTERSEPEPRLRLGSWFNPPQLLAVDVQDVMPGEPIRIDRSALAHPVGMGEIAPGRYTVQGVAKRSPDSPKPGRGEGDLFSSPRRIDIDAGSGGRIELRLTEVAEAQAFRETDRIKLVEIRSDLLSDFLGRDRAMRAAVILPDGWDDDDDKAYPVCYFIGGFGGTHFDVFRLARQLGPEGAAARRILWVVPDPSCRLGHSVFADSANNGPWGQALTEELIPAVESRFRGAGAAHRHVTGVSSGGWSCLWLQITYPDAFAGCWSHVPDPIDFHDFQQIDLYEPGSNMYLDESGDRRPIARRGGEVAIYYADFVRREEVVGPGGQIHSFEAVFSPRGEDGNPVRVFDRRTGAVDTESTRAWEDYDIARLIDEQWDTLGPHVEQKVHIFAGEFDTFYLEGAVRRLKSSLDAAGRKVDVRIVDGMGHELHTDGFNDMIEAMLDAWERPD